MSKNGFPPSSSSPTGPPADSVPWPADPLDRAAAAAAAGLRRPVPKGMAAALEHLVAGDADPRVRAAALGALARLPDRPSETWRRAAADADPVLRRREPISRQPLPVPPPPMIPGRAEVVARWPKVS